jgi:ABC-type Fe3+/spermidine/putrescine transport system ATPase subunit
VINVEPSSPTWAPGSPEVVRTSGREVSEPLLQVSGLVKRFGQRKVGVKGVSFDAREGEFVSLLGPSGCGKTTTLRCIAGLVAPDDGSIVVGGAVLDGAAERGRICVPPERRGLSMVFQQYALWPHMSVFENVAFGLKTQRVPRPQIGSRVQRALDSVRLWSERDSKIAELSGGQQQRIALARALVVNPKLVLFDEPLSNLDSRLRDALRLELLELQQQVGFTAIYVTHDQEEALSLSSRVIVMNAGLIEQIGTPRQIWDMPATGFVAEFTGANQLVGELAERSGGWMLAIDGAGELLVGAGTSNHHTGRVDAFVRPTSIEVTTIAPAQPALRGTVLVRSFHGDYTLVKVRVGSQEVACHARPDLRDETTDVFISVDPADIHLYSPATSATN